MEDWKDTLDPLRDAIVDALEGHAPGSCRALSKTFSKDANAAATSALLEALCFVVAAGSIHGMLQAVRAGEECPHPFPLLDAVIEQLRSVYFEMMIEAGATLGKRIDAAEAEEAAAQ